MGIIMDLGADDIGYVCMPLFHSNALHGRVGAVDRRTARRSVSRGRFSASGWLADVRHYGATYFNYTGKPLAYILAHARAARRRRQHAARRVRQRGLARGRRRVRAALRRRGDRRVRRDRGRRRGQPRRRASAPARWVRPADDVKVVDEDGNEARRRQFDERRPAGQRGRVRRRDRQHRGRRAVRGLLQQRRGQRADDALRLVLDAATSATSTPTATSTSRAATPTGSGSTARTSPPGRSRTAIRAIPTSCSPPSYGVPDDQAGDQVMVGLVLRDGAAFDPAAFARGSTGSADVGPKWRPRYVRLLARPADDGDEQDRQAHARAPEVAPRPGRRATSVFVRGRGEAMLPPVHS